MQPPQQPGQQPQYSFKNYKPGQPLAPQTSMPPQSPAQYQRYYKFSGKINFLGLFLMGMLGFFVALVFGIIYPIATTFIPFIYINVLLTVGFGWIIGFTLSQTAFWGKVRNPGLVAALSFLFALFGLYISWILWVMGTAPEDFDIAFGPIGIFGTMAEIAKEGAWGLGDWTPTGIFLYAVWLIEAAIILGMAVVFAHGRIVKRPYCEYSHEWLKETESILPLETITDVETFKAQLEQGDYKSLKALKPVEIGTLEFTQLDLKHSQYLFLLTVKNVTVKIDKKGKEDKKETDIVEFLIIDPTTYEAVMGLIPPEMAMPEPMKA